MQYLVLSPILIYSEANRGSRKKSSGQNRLAAFVVPHRPPAYLPGRWLKAPPPRVLSLAQRAVLDRMNQNKQLPLMVKYLGILVSKAGVTQ